MKVSAKGGAMANPDYSAWDLVDEFTPSQAACLWFDSEPEADEDIPESSRVRAIADRILRETGITGINARPAKLKATRAELVVLAEKLNARPPFLFAETRRQPEKELAKREKRTLLVIIEALAQLASVDTTHPEKAGTTIEAKTQELGARVARRTIANKLREIPDALEVRSKDER